VRTLAPRRTLTPGDGLVLEMTARAGAEYDRAQTAMQADGLTIRTVRGSLRAHPAATIADRAWTRFLAGLRELAATPRTRSSVDPAPEDAVRPKRDSLEALLRHRESKWRGLIS
jgi:P27 family predicted phage terminase small subunit